MVNIWDDSTNSFKLGEMKMMPSLSVRFLDPNVPQYLKDKNIDIFIDKGSNEIDFNKLKKFIKVFFLARVRMEGNSKFHALEFRKC
jgi:hypothetical protein